ncbi:MAG: hypothetical protein KDK51_08165, partial [Deltaproteobacteria bacterium]|nr:hypothetical protein [Deltaproteobacteria bacterium]
DLFQRTALIPHAVMEEENSSFEEIILKGVFSARFYASIEYLAHCADYVGSSYHYFSLPALRAPPLMHI